MTREETVNLLMTIQAAFPNYKVPDKSVAVNTWFMMLSDYEYKNVMMALKSYIATDTSGFAPSIGQVIDKLHSAESIGEMNEMEAWSMVRQRLSAYNVMKNYAELPEAVQKAVGSPQNLKEWALLPTNEVDTVIQSNFLKSYRVQKNRERELKRLPSDVRQILLQGSNLAQIEQKSI